MNTPLLGPRTGPATFTSFQPRLAPIRTERRSPWLRVLIFLWALGGLGYFAYHFTVRSHEPVKAAPQSPTTPNHTADVLHHVELALDKDSISAAALLRVENQLRATLPTLDSYSLAVEKRRVESSIAMIAAARRDLEAAREHLEIVSTSIKENH